MLTAEQIQEIQDTAKEIQREFCRRVGNHNPDNCALGIEIADVAARILMLRAELGERR